MRLPEPAFTRRPRVKLVVKWDVPDLSQVHLGDLINALKRVSQEFQPGQWIHAVSGIFWRQISWKRLGLPGIPDQAVTAHGTPDWYLVIWNGELKCRDEVLRLARKWDRAGAKVRIWLPRKLWSQEAENALKAEEQKDPLPNGLRWLRWEE